MKTDYELATQRVLELKDTIKALQEHNHDLNEMIGRLSEENKELKSMFSYVRCKYPPYVVADAFGISSRAVTAIDDEMNMFDNENYVLRIPRVNKEEPKNHETTVIFSLLGVAKMFYYIKGELKDFSNANSVVYKYIEDNIDTVVKVFSDNSDELEDIISSSHKKFGKLLSRLAK